MIHNEWLCHLRNKNYLSHSNTHTLIEQSVCVPANVRQRLPSAAETDGYDAELSLLTRVARSINTSAQHTHSSSRVPASKEGESESLILWHETATKPHCRTLCKEGWINVRAGIAVVASFKVFFTESKRGKEFEVLICSYFLQAWMLLPCWNTFLKVLNLATLLEDYFTVSNTFKN